MLYINKKMKNTNPTTPSGQVGDDHFFVDKSGPVLFTCMRMIVGRFNITMLAQNVLYSAPSAQHRSLWGPHRDGTEGTPTKPTYGW